jgi:hypothetical protein
MQYCFLSVDELCGMLLPSGSDDGSSCSRLKWCEVLGDVYLTEMQGRSLQGKTLEEVSSVL